MKIPSRKLAAAALYVSLAACWLWAPPEAGAQRFQGGVVAGVNLCQIDGDRLAGYNQPGLNAGGRVAAILAPRWQLALEMLYSQQGSRRTLNDDPGAVYESIRLNIVETPLMLTFIEWKFHLSAGVSYGRLISYKVVDVYGEDVSETQDFNPNLFKFTAGLSYFFNERIGVNAGWSIALNNLQADPGSGKYLGKNIHIRGVYLF